MEITRTELENTEISYCKGCKSTVTYPTTISAALNKIKDGTYSRNTVYCRNKENPEAERDRIKSNMDAFLFSGEFSSRHASALEHYTKILVFDLDHLEDAYSTKELLKDDQFIIATWISVRGCGVKGLIPLDYSEIEESVKSDDEEVNWVFCHKMLAFKQVEQYFKEKYDLILDSSGSDIGRLCFASYDSELVYKAKAMCFHVKKPSEDGELKNKKEVEKQPESRKPIHYDEKSVQKIERRKNNYARRKIVSIIKFLSKQKKSITSSYDDWYLVGQAIANTFSYPTGKELYLRLCRLDGSRHDEEKSIRKLIECYQNNDLETRMKYVTYSSIMRLAGEQKWSCRARSKDAEKGEQ